MKRLKLLVGLLMTLVILGAVKAPTASAENLLDGVWLKVKVNVKGYSVDPDSGAYAKSNGGGTGYFHFVWNEDHYDIAVWTDPYGAWDITFKATANTHPPRRKLYPSPLYTVCW